MEHCDIAYPYFGALPSVNCVRHNIDWSVDTVPSAGTPFHFGSFNKT